MPTLCLRYAKYFKVLVLAGSIELQTYVPPVLPENRMLNVIHSLQRTNIMAVEDDLALEFVPVLLDVVVLDHDDHHIHLVEELVEIQDLVLHQFFVREEGVEAAGSQNTPPLL